jgi:hypothetical protein
MKFDRQHNPRRYNNPSYSRGYLPRHDAVGTLQSNTFRLIDAVPEFKVLQWKQELEIIPDTPMHDSRRIELHRRISNYEDLGRGECWLGDAAIAQLAAILRWRALRHASLVYYAKSRPRYVPSFAAMCFGTNLPFVEIFYRATS